MPQSIRALRLRAGVQKSIAYECTSPRSSTELHQRAAGGIKKCCSIKETKQMLRRGHSNLPRKTRRDVRDDGHGEQGCPEPKPIAAEHRALARSFALRLPGRQRFS
jgi:hypothetical protein